MRKIRPMFVRVYAIMCTRFFPLVVSLSIGILTPSLSFTLSLYFLLSISFLISYPPSHHIIHNIYIYIYYICIATVDLYTSVHYGVNTPDLCYSRALCVFVLGPAGHCSRQFRLGQTVWKCPINFVRRSGTTAACDVEMSLLVSV